MSKKFVRFNYFETMLAYARLEMARDLAASGQEIEGDLPEFSDVWDMSGFLDHLFSKRNQFSTSVCIGDEYADIEPDSYRYDEVHHIYGIQLSKCRDTNIPSKKKLGQIKEEIMLNDDEYIGEFNSILYDNRLGVAMVQSNRYGLSVRQTEKYLTELRLMYLDEIGKGDDEPLVVRLRPIIDPSKLEKALNAEYYRKIKIRTSDVMQDAIMSDRSLLSDLRNTLFKVSGVNIEVNISVGPGKRTESLDSGEIRKVLREFGNLDEYQRPNIEVTLRENEDADVDVINLVEPRMTDRVAIEISPRTTIGHDYLFREMLSVYYQSRSQIHRILVPQGG